MESCSKGDYLLLPNKENTEVMMIWNHLLDKSRIDVAFISRKGNILRKAKEMLTKRGYGHPGLVCCLHDAKIKDWESLFSKNNIIILDKIRSNPRNQAVIIIKPVTENYNCEWVKYVEENLLIPYDDTESLKAIQ